MPKGIVTDIRFTFSSPFGEQWTKIRHDGNEVEYATWWDYRDGIKVGAQVEFEYAPPATCSLGGRASITISPCASIVRVIPES